MLVILLIFTFIFSLFIGSFINVIVDRVYRGEQFLRGRSYCESCKHILTAKDLVPLVSYVSLDGKCRYCDEKLSSFYPFSELLTASFLTLVVYLIASFSTVYNHSLIRTNAVSYNLGFVFVSIFFILLAIVLLIIFLTDLKYFVIPDVYLYSLLAIYILTGFLYFLHLKEFLLIPFPFDLFVSNFFNPFWDHFASAILMGLFFAALHYGTKKKAMGEGDIYLSAIFALYLGPVLSIIMWFVSFVSGALVGIALVLFGKRKLKSAVPFGPFLIIGAISAYLLHTQILDFYLNLLYH